MWVRDNPIRDCTDADLFILPEEIHWIRNDLAMKPGNQQEYMVRIRYRQPLQEAALHMTEKGMFIIFGDCTAGVAAGQFAAWYEENELLGSGVIHHARIYRLVQTTLLV